MAFGTDRNVLTQVGTQDRPIDQGLRRYMLRVYNYMASGVALTGVVAMLIASSPEAVKLLFGTPLKWVVMLAPIGLVFFLGARIQHMKASTAQALFWVYAGMVGASLATVFVVFTGASVARAFFIAAAAFAGLSLYGYTTKKDLSGFGSFLIMGVWGLLIAGIVNMIWPNGMLQFVISAAGVLIFAGLTAWDTQNIKRMYSEAYDPEDASKLAIMGALSLYMDFINLFMFILHFVGVRNDE